MTPEALQKMLKDFKRGRITSTEFIQRLKYLPYKITDCASIDHHREIRTGFPEVVFCMGKTDNQVIKIAGDILKQHKLVLCTHVALKLYKKIKKKYPDAIYKKEASAVVIDKRKKITIRYKAVVAVVTAGTADIPVAEEACLVPELMGIPVKRFFDIGVAGLHRFLGRLQEISDSSVVIAVAGMDGVLPSIIAGSLDTPVIAVPTSVGYGINLGGIAPLFTMLNSCSAGLGVMNIDNGFGAGVLATTIIRKFEKRK